jgi:molybdopterin/thiamine biosynthesis adenylyltransferase
MVWFPLDLQPIEGSGDLYGYFHPSTNQVVVLPSDASVAGSINLSRGPGSPGLQARQVDGVWQFSVSGRPCQVRPYDLEVDLTSRHSGLLETAAMRQSGVILCGCGSVGSLAALDLARSGVGRFLLVDDDILSIENLCRHQCSIADVGRYKVDAVADRIRQINPYAEVITASCALEHLDPAVVAAFCQDISLFLACADSRRADRYAARLAVALQQPFLSIGLWERAFAGELFFWQPSRSLPCYSCAFAGLDPAFTARPQAARSFYSTDRDLQELSFQPGLAVDIALVTQVGLKLALDLLNHGNEEYVPRLLNQLSQYTLVCNSNDPRLGGEEAEIFSYPLQVTTSIQLSAAGGSKQCTCCR